MSDKQKIVFPFQNDESMTSQKLISIQLEVRERYRK